MPIILPLSLFLYVLIFFLIQGYSSKNKKHHSGPLLVHGGDIDEILRAHERQIQQAVRKANLDKVKNKKVYIEQAQSESLLHHSRMAI